MRSIIIDEDEKICYICGGYASDRHHCLHGSMRPKAEKFGLVVMLCRRCHSLVHDKHINDEYLQKMAQEVWETHYNKTTEDFIKEFGKSYK